MKTETIIAVVVIATIAVSLVYFSGWQTKARLDHANCIVNAAKAQGYRGDPHSLEAWKIFSPDCK